MSRLEPLPPETLPEQTRQIMEFAQNLMGFVPNDVLTMARWPALLNVMQQLVGVIYGPGRLDEPRPTRAP